MIYRIHMSMFIIAMLQAEDSGSAGGGAAPPKVSEFRAKFDKFEKFGGVKPGLKKAGATTTGGAGDVKNADVDKSVKVGTKL